MTQGKKGERLYTLDVFLTDGPIGEEFEGQVIGRTIQIKGDQTLGDLHHAIFSAFDREEQHLYEFNFGEGPCDQSGPLYGPPPAWSSPLEQDREDTYGTTLDSLGLEEGRIFGYWFDFGDDWMHQVNVVKVEDAPARVLFPRVTGRTGESPPQYPPLDEEEEFDDDEMDDQDAPALLSEPDPDELEELVGREFREELESKPLSPDTDLRVALTKLPAEWTKGMCAEFGLTGITRQKERVKAIIDYLTDPGSLEETWRKLPEPSRRMLRWLVVDEGGFTTTHQLSEAFGPDDDDTCWWNKGERPTTALGVLRLNGLVFVGTTTTGGWRVKIAVVPVELRERLADVAGKPGNAPAAPNGEQGENATEDILAAVLSSAGVPEELYELLKRMPEDTREELLTALGQPDEGPMLFGECPCCNELNIGDCSEVEGLEDPTIGLCDDCGFVWCIECGSMLLPSCNCGHWAVCDECAVEKDEFGDCGHLSWECKTVIEEYSEKIPFEKFKNTCSRCGKDIPGSVDTCGPGAKVKKGASLEGMEGITISLFLKASQMCIPATVPAKDPSARGSGHDLVFYTCSPECARALGSVLEKEIEIIDRTEVL